MTADPAATMSRPLTAAEQIEVYFEKGWSDGLPVVPPTAELVQAMLEAARLEPTEVVCEIQERHLRLTADKVAINAVMAGCKPEYMPVVATAVKALGCPEFGYHHVSSGTGGSSLGIIVNGPIVKRIGINFRDNMLGPGVRANATIGRALRLVMMNLTRARPGALDRATLGTPGKYTLCIAENEEESPWQPLHVDRGFRRDQSTVSLFASSTLITCYNNQSATPEPILRALAWGLAHPGAISLIDHSPGLVIFGGEHTEVIHRSGWSKQQVRDFIIEHARQTIADLKRAGRIPGEITPEDEHTYRQAMLPGADLILLCAGARSGSFSVCMSGFGSSRRDGRSRTYPIKGE
ncbi:MAG: hypothetical protein HY423_00760 [Candidatus Lambdaproteobacteria bacterium]|nr:hypothetical protein [Candidatus Lambdaproteobacteria bacterium]